MKKKKLFIILGIFIIIILIVIIGDRKRLTFIERGIKDAYSFVIKYVSIPFDYAKEKLDELTTKGDLYQENKKLLEQLNELEYLKIENNELRSSIDNLKSLLGLNSTLSDYNKTNATIIDRNLGYWYDTLVIDKGESDGIKIGEAVVTSEGLIGYINTINYKTSEVKLITSSSSNKITVKIESDRYVYGVLSGYSNGYLIIDNVEDNVNIGDIVTTAGLGTNFPEGIYIGIVELIESDNFDLIKKVKVKPKINYNLISNVCILERK
ncbi:MAG: rod shape-determining protein MreC [Clostridium sp.]|nr:rod shape-determining protein MreC [Clostridium sp.]MCM1444480.1 rod shape-determining protein MreC [Candidatus Amulumruptor caecigallinarius]